MNFDEPYLIYDRRYIATLQGSLVVLNETLLKRLLDLCLAAEVKLGRHLLAKDATDGIVCRKPTNADARLGRRAANVRENDTAGFAHERVISRDVWLTLDDIESGSPDFTFPEGSSERVGVYDRTAAWVDEYRGGFHAREEGGVDGVVSPCAAWCKNEEYVRVRGELVE